LLGGSVVFWVAPEKRGGVGGGVGGGGGR